MDFLNKKSKITPAVHTLLNSMGSYFVLLRYMLTSVIIAAIDYIVFFGVYRLSNDVAAGVFIARTVAILVNFTLLQRRVFFYHGQESPALIKYVLLVFTAGLITTLLIQLFTQYLLFDVIIAKLAAEWMLYFINYFIVKKYIFKLNRS